MRHEDVHKVWHYLYFGYTHHEKRAHAYALFRNQEIHLDFPKHKHFYAHTLYIYVGRDIHYPNYNGRSSLIKVNFGKGAFEDQLFDKHDYFTVVKGQETLFGTVPIEWESEKQEPFTVAFDSTEEVVDYEVEDSAEEKINGASEYSFSFWSRWSRVMPKDIH